MRKIYNITRLWNAVIIQAVIDANNSNDFSYFKTKSFKLICEFANINQQWIEKQIYTLKAKNKYFATSTKSPNFLDIRIKR
jgi:hypothetical protein